MAESLGGALAFSSSGIVYAAARGAGAEPFTAVLLLAVALAVFGTFAATRTGPSQRRDRGTTVR
ncbi:hypothetical protein GCM10023339_46540 [Alloalcanivorax gelatiniphagus]